MSGNPNDDRRTRRRAATTGEIIDAAWELVRREGLAGLSMRELGDRVGMRAQSVYSYFGSKHEIFDAMFRDGFQAFAAHMEDVAGDGSSTDEPAELARRGAHAYVEFCVVDPARFQLLFQRTVPGFEPSSESYAVSQDSYEWMVDHLAAAGVVGQPALDLWTATLVGIVNQQVANDPGGTRWIDLVDRAVDMLLVATTPDTTTAAHSRDRPSEPPSEPSTGLKSDRPTEPSDRPDDPRAVSGDEPAEESEH